MGSYFFTLKENKIRLADDIIEDSCNLLITINLHTNPLVSYNDQLNILKYLQYTNPIASYILGSSIKLLYNPAMKIPLLRHNVVSSIISYLSSEITIWILKNAKCNLHMTEVHIDKGSFQLLLEDFLDHIKVADYIGIIQHDGKFVELNPMTNEGRVHNIVLVYDELKKK